MAYETDEERKARQKSELLAEAEAHKAHLESPSLEKPPWFYENLASFTKSSPPEIPATPTAQDIVDALVILGLVTQAE
jgi:hypothetical protein